MADALVGCTGFVGRNLLLARPFDHTFHSRNVEELRGLRCDRLWCAAMPGTKWRANKEPERDRANMEALREVLDTVHCGCFVLISTIDVMLDVPYGRHRREFEEWVAGRFGDHRIVRLPALFGHGLKKNVLYDLLTGNMLDSIHPGDAFQWYDLADLVADVALAEEHGVRELDLYTEPVENRDLLSLFPDFESAPQPREARRYDCPSAQAGLFGRERYVRSAGEMLDRIARFVGGVRAGEIPLG